MVLLIILCAVLCIPIGGIYWKRHSKDEPVPDAWEQATASMGEPNHIIVADPLRGNERDGVILVYDHGGRDDKGFLVFNNTIIHKRDITGLTVNNAAIIPYFPNDYQIVITTPSGKLHIHTGRDMGWSQEVLMQIKASTPTE